MPFKKYLDTSTPSLPVQADENIAGTAKQATVAEIARFRDSRIAGDVAPGDKVITPLQHGSLHKQLMFQVRLTGTMPSIPQATVTKVNFNTIDYNPDSTWDGTNFRFAPGRVGLYLLGGRVTFGTNGQTGQATHYILIQRNGAAFAYCATTAARGDFSTTISGFALLYVTDVADYFELYVYQQSGGARSLLSVDASPVFYGYRLAPYL